jgi:hypothetical protein
MSVGETERHSYDFQLESDRSNEHSFAASFCDAETTH